MSLLLPTSQIEQILNMSEDGKSAKEISGFFLSTYGATVPINKVEHYIKDGKTLIDSENVRKANEQFKAPKKSTAKKTKKKKEPVKEKVIVEEIHEEVEEETQTETRYSIEGREHKELMLEFYINDEGSFIVIKNRGLIFNEITQINGMDMG